MSNLGAYQLMTTYAKKVGGPANLMMVVGTCGYLVLRGGEAVIKYSCKKVKSFYDKMQLQEEIIYDVKNEGVSNEGVVFKVGDQFRVLETAADAILIELKGDANNPYFVDVNLLKEISDYK